MIHDHGENDPIPFELGSWNPVAGKVRDDLELMHGRSLTYIEIPTIHRMQLQDRVKSEAMQQLEREIEAEIGRL